MKTEQTAKLNRYQMNFQESAFKEPMNRIDEEVLVAMMGSVYGLGL